MTTENFKEIILPAIETILDVYSQSGDVELEQVLESRFAEYENTPLPLECHNILKDLNKQKRKIDRKWKAKNIVTNAVSKAGRHKVAAVGISAVLLLGGGLVGCTKTGGATEKSSDNIVTILEGNEQINHGTKWAENFAANGAYDENAKESSDMFAIATVLDSFANRDQYANQYLDALALGANYNSREEVQAVGRSFFEAHQQIVLAKGEIKYEQVLEKEKDAKLLNELQAAWKDVSVKASDDKMEKFDELIADFVENINQYSPFAIRLGVEYVTMGSDTPWKDGTLVSQNTVDLFYKNIQNCCNTTYCASTLSQENQPTANSTLQSVSDTLLYGYVDDLLKDKQHDHVKDGEVLYSYTEIRDGIAEKIKDLKNSEKVDLEENAYNVSMENAEQRSIQQNGDVPKVSSSDKIITKPNGEKVIDSGRTVVDNSKGDEKDAGAKDNNGNSTTVEEMNHTYKEGYEDCINANGNESSKKYPNDSTYMDGWNTAKKDIEKLQNEQKGQQTVTSTTQNQYYDSSDKNNNTTTETKPEESKKDEVKQEDVKPEESKKDEEKTNAGETVTETTENVYYDTIIGTDGQKYDINDFTDISTNPELESSRTK